MPEVAIPTPSTDRPELGAFTRRCRGRAPRRLAAKASSTGALRAELARRLLELRLLRRGRWALHRHVHLVAAFEDATSRAPVTSMLSVGCGAGVSELLLAVSNPGVRFTLGDVRPESLARIRRFTRTFGIANARVLELDVIDPPPMPRHDLVVSVEMLEHIDDDERAAASLLALSRRFVWILVPFADERRLQDPVAIRRAVDRHGHVRPGYSARTLAERVEGAEVVWLRSCYRQPQAGQVRRWLDGHGFLARRLAAGRLFRAAADDVRAGLVPDDDSLAQGIEVLVDVS